MNGRALSAGPRVTRRLPADHTVLSSAAMAMTSPALFELGTQVRVLGEREHGLRQLPSSAAKADALSARLPQPPTSAGLSPQDDERLLGWTWALELCLVFAGLHEAVSVLGLTTVGEVSARIAEVESLVETRTRLRVTDVFAENEEWVRPYRGEQLAPNTPLEVDGEALLRAVQSFVLHCPIQELLAMRAEQPELAHRSRLAYDGLRAFVTRHAHSDKQAMQVTGDAYADGRLTIDEAAKVLRLSVIDAVALLEEQGFRRSVEGLRLTDEARTKRLASIRAERLSRNGEPQLSEELVSRDVAASQRIEDVDARPWLGR